MDTKPTHLDSTPLDNELTDDDLDGVVGGVSPSYLSDQLPGGGVDLGPESLADPRPSPTWKGKGFTDLKSGS